MLDLSAFPPSQMVACGGTLRRLGTGAGSMEEAAGRIVGYLYENLGTPTGERACALVRFYKTHPYGELDTELSEFAATVLGERELLPSTRCLVLLATVGERPEWHSRHRSSGHRAIPLASPQVVASAPMIAQLLEQFGLDVDAVIRPDPSVLIDAEQRTYNVFYVPEAVGSPYVPAQADFVLPYGIRSVLGFGGVFPTGDLLTVILFSKIAIPREVANRFKTLALAVKLATLPFLDDRVFTGRGHGD